MSSDSASAAHPVEAGGTDRTQQKRPADEEEEETKSKRQRQGEIAPQPAPIFLFATATDVQARRGQSQEHWSKKQCLTLREMLGIGDYRDDSTTMGPIDFLFIANYVINFEFLLDECPELLSLPRAVCIYGSKEGTEDAWRQACTTLDGSCSVDFLCRNPSDPSGSPTNPLAHKIPFGLHHTKLFLVGFASGLLRVVVHTANLRFPDIHHKAQGAYMQDFSRKNSNSDSSVTNDFEESLVDYLESYKYEKQHKWDGSSTATTLADHLRKYDFSSASVTLIPSIPGYHKIGGNNNKYGHLKLRKEVASVGGNDAKGANRKITGHIALQFSSIGSLTKKYLHRLAYSMDINNRANTSSTSGNSSEDDESKPLNLQLVYPTSDEICNSLEGYKGGNSVPGNKKNVSKDFLQPLFRKWSASVSFLSSLSLSRQDDSSSTNPLWKGNNVPHIKSYFQLCGEKEDAMEWFVIGSHNLSKAAWGDVQDSKVYGEKRFFIRHWELGVFLSPRQLHAKRLVPWTPERGSSTKNQGDITIPLPYRVKPEHYTESDKPWAVDERYVRLDIFGRRSASDA